MDKDSSSAGQSRRQPGIAWNQVAPLGFAAGMTAVGLVIGYLIKNQCVTNVWADNFQYTHFCYNEIQALFVARGINLGLIPYIDTRFEYPVLTGMFMDLAGRVLRALVRLGVVDANGDGGYLAVSALMLAPFAFAVTLMLRPRVSRARLMIWAVGAPCILYIFHNWDLLAVCGAVWGLVSLERSRISVAGSALAVGASAKLFPVFFMPAALLGRWAANDRRGARNLLLGFLATYVLINLPWYLLSGGPPRVLGLPGLSGVDLRQPGTNGWMQVWLFHADRYPDYWTVWYWIAKYGRLVKPDTWWNVGQTGYRDFVNLASLVLFAFGSLWVLWKGWKRRGVDGAGSYPVAAVSLGILALFLLTSKVYSPQYALWMVPLLVLLNIAWRLVFAYMAAEVAVLVSGFFWFTVIDQPAPAWLGALEAAVWVRALVLLLLLRFSLSAVRALPQLGPSSAPGEPNAAQGKISSHP